MNRKTCGCESYMNDWNSWRHDECENCRRERSDKRLKRDLRVSKDEGRCLDCVKLDRYGKVNDGGRYFSKGECLNCFTKRGKEILNNFSLTSFSIEEAKTNSKVIMEYKVFNPNFRSVDTKVFENWFNEKIRIKYYG